MKLWGGRFEQGPSEVFERFSGSLHFDRRLIEADIRGSQAFARALERVGILTRGGARPAGGGVRGDRRGSEAAGVLRGRGGRGRPHAGDPQAQGARRAGWRIRSTRAAAATSRCRSIRGCGCARRSTSAAALLLALMQSLLDLAGRYPDAVIPGYTHMRRAQAVLWPHYLLAYFEMFARDWERLRQARARVEPDAAGVGRAGRQRVPVRPRGDGPRSRLRRPHAQQHGRFGRPRFRARFSVCGFARDAAPEPAGGGLDSLFERGVRVAGTGRRGDERVEPDAAEEESGFAGADSRQVRARFRML